MNEAVLKQRHLPYAGRLESRNHLDIVLAVIHCTELPDLATAREYGERILYPDSGTGNSGHFYIDRDGQIEQWVPVDHIAHHVRGHNANSIGVELVNLGRYPNWFDSAAQQMTEPYPEAQMTALVSLLRDLSSNHPSLDWIAGHEQLDKEQVPATDNPQKLVYRKQDPGPLFPWSKIMRALPLNRLPADWPE